jgi:hypothetical protein
MSELLVLLSELRMRAVTAPLSASTMARAATNPSCQVMVGRPAATLELYGSPSSPAP